MIDEDVRIAARKIKLLLMDCDGVLTDGRLYFSAGGETMKVFHVRDGQGISLWHEAGFQSGIITGRDADPIVRLRAAELGMHFVRSRSEDKVRDLNEIVASTTVTLEETAYIGDDVGDLAALGIVGFSVAPSDAHGSVRDAVNFVTAARGGSGMVREVVDLLLDCKK